MQECGGIPLQHVGGQYNNTHTGGVEEEHGLGVVGPKRLPRFWRRYWRWRWWCEVCHARSNRNVFATYREVLGDSDGQVDARVGNVLFQVL